MLEMSSLPQSSRFCIVVDDVIMSGFEFTDVMMSVSCYPMMLLLKGVHTNTYTLTNTHPYTLTHT